jgi:hypothetical protein
MYKQDFTNTLDLEIDNLEKLSGAIINEIKIRKECNLSIPDLIQRAVNEKVVFQLEAELRSKNEFMEKLKSKKLEDAAEIEEEFIEVANNYEDLFEKFDSLESEHDRHYAKLYMDEFHAYYKKEHQEACVYYYNCFKRLFENK